MTYQFNEAQEAWLKALESGRYRQTHGVLRDSLGYCCLGLACKLIGEKPSRQDDADVYTFGPDKEISFATKRATEALRLRTSGGQIRYGRKFKSLAHMNDDGKTFAEIAAFIRSNPTAVFKE